MKRSDRLSHAATKLRELALAQRKVEATSEARRALPPGSSRAKVTTANARWSTACEAHDRIEAELRRLGVSISEAAVIAPQSRAALVPNPLLSGARAARFGSYDVGIAELLRLEAAGFSRQRLRSTYAFAIPDWRALEACVEYGPIVEMGAGSGYWASLIAASGGDVIAYDDGSWDCFEASRRFHPITHGTPSALAAHADRTLLLVWPPMSSMAAECLDHYRGERVIYVGEDSGGCTADDAFHERLDADFARLARVAIPQWWGIHDDLTVWRRK